MIINSYIFGPSIDPDAQAFITAAAITDPTQQSAINTLVVDLKGYNIWTKMKGLYPFCGSTASQHKWNLKDPRDLDVAFRLVFNGGWTHSVNGATPNGTNAYADSKYATVTNLNLSSHAFGIYSRTNDTSGTQSYGIFEGVGFNNLIQNTLSTGVFYDGAAGNTLTYTANPTTSLIMLTRRSQSNWQAYRAGVSLGTRTTGCSFLTGKNFFFGARNTGDNITANQFNKQQLAFAFLSDGLTDTEAANFYTAVQAFQTTLGRSIGTQTVSDSDAQAFVTNAGIVDQVEANAINNLVIGLKADGLWTKMKAVYPMVGGSSSTMKYNLVNPLDTDAAFRLVFNGGWTFSSNGALPNGTNAFASTKLNAFASLTNNNTHLSYYSRTSTITNGVRDMGCYQNAGVPSMALGTNTGVWISDQNDFNIRISSSIASATGFYTGTRTSSTSHKLYKNGAVLGTNTSANSQALPNINIFIGAVNVGAIFPSESASSYGNKECAFASIGDGLSDTDATNLNSRVTTFQTALNRNV